MCAKTAADRTFSRRREDLSHNGSAATGGTQEKGRSNNAPLNYGNLNYSRVFLARTINSTVNLRMHRVRDIAIRNNGNGIINKQKLASFLIHIGSEIFLAAFIIVQMICA